jgi:hypothetical protein
VALNRAGSLLAASASGERASGRQAWGLLWASSRPLAAGVIAWMVAGALVPVAVVVTLGLVVGSIPGTVSHGISSADGHRLIAALILAALIYGLSLIADPVGSALGTAASARITGQLQERLLAAVTGPVGVGHLENTEVLDRLARAEGSLTGFFPGDAPVTWAGSLAGRISGVNLAAVESVGLADLPRADDEPAALAALDRAGAGDLPGQLPDGLATYVGTKFTGGTGLSGGQWQKLALGRAMRAADPLLVVLDEPTASLDAPSEHALFERYAEAARDAAATGTVTVLVSHRFATVQMADLIIYMEEGRVTEIGGHDELLATGGRYAELFGLQAEAFR